MGERVTISDYDGSKTAYIRKRADCGWSLGLPHSYVVIDIKVNQSCLLLQRVF